MRNPGDPAYDPPGVEGMGGAPHHRALQLAALLSGLKLLWSHRDAKGKVILLPVGSLEDRPLGPAQLDTLLATMVSVEASLNNPGCLVALPVAYGYSPAHRKKVEVQPIILLRFVEDVIRGFYRLGASNVIVVDGHYGHRNLVGSAAFIARANYINLWSIVTKVTQSYTFEEQLELEKRIVRSIFEGVWPRELEMVVEYIKKKCRSKS